MRQILIRTPSLRGVTSTETVIITHFQEQSIRILVGEGCKKVKKFMPIPLLMMLLTRARMKQVMLDII